MAITVSTDQTVISQCETPTGWNASLGSTWAGSPAGSNDVYLEGSNAINARVSTSTPGTIKLNWAIFAHGSVSFPSAGHIYFWIKSFCLPSLEKRVRGGIGLIISSDTFSSTKSGTDPWSGHTNSAQWFLTGVDFEPLSGWVCYVVDPTSTPDLKIGAPSLTGIIGTGIRAGALQAVGAGSVKPLPILWDRLAYGTGLTIITTAGETADFDDFYVNDSATANQYGVISKAVGIYFISGKLNFGKTDQSAVTTFADTNQVLVWQDMPVGTSFYELKLFGAASFATTVTLGSYGGSLAANGCVIRGAGLTTRRLIAPVIVAGGTGYTANDILTVSGGTSTVAAQFKVITVSSGVITEIRMETAGSYIDPPTGTLSVTGGTGSSATFTATVVGGSIWTLTANQANQTLKLYACTLSQMKAASLTTTGEWRSCTIDDSGEITAGGATIDSCTFQNLRTIAPISATYQIRVVTTTPTLTNNTFINCATAILWNRAADTNGKLDGCSFVSSGTGHAIEFGTNIPGSPTEITLTNVTFSNYGADGTANAAIYNNSAKQLIINISGGTIPTVKNGSGASTTLNTTQATTTITVKDADTLVAIQNAEVLVTASDDLGPMPYQDSASLTRTDSIVTVTATAHGLINGKKVLIKGATQSEYNGVHTIAYVDANTFTYTLPNTSTASGHTITASTGEIILSGGINPITLGFRVGANITLSGFTNPGNNTTKVISSLSSFAIYMTDIAGLVTESGSTPPRVVKTTPATPATGSPVITGVVIYDLTNASGIVTDTRTHASDQPITGRARKSTGSPYYKTGQIVGTIDSVDGYSTIVQMIRDE